MKEKNDLFWEILADFQTNGVLEDVILAGSWCLLFYKKHFENHPLIPKVRTMDLDFMVRNPPRIQGKKNIGQILEKMGFSPVYDYLTGLVKFQNPDIEVEFLIPEKGKGKEEAYKIGGLGVTAQGLRFLELIEHHTMVMSDRGVSVTLPKPEIFALHKILINERRLDKAKKIKDLETAKSLLTIMSQKEDSIEYIQKVFAPLPKKWKSSIRRTTTVAFPEFIEILESK